MGKRDFPPIHPGEILLTEFLKPMGVTQYPTGQRYRRNSQAHQ